MGCRTGFCMSLIGCPNRQPSLQLGLVQCKNILNVKEQHDIPELNEYQCGTYTEHSLTEAHQIAQKTFIERESNINKNDELLLDESFINKNEYFMTTIGTALTSSATKVMILAVES